MRSRLILFHVIFLFASCIDYYPIPEIRTTAGYLVVDGFINSAGPTTIRLSHTLAVYDPYNIPLPELKAKVDVESEDRTSVYSLTERGKGIYSVDFLPIDYGKRYRIHIMTVKNKEYVSEYVEVKQTPPIDYVSWEVDEVNKGVQVYANSTDPNNKTRFYSWDYVETWQYKANYTTLWEYINNRPVWNPYREQMFDCWMTKKSTSIFVMSTERLSQSVVHKFPLLFIPYNSEKFAFGYRIVVTQYAVTEDHYKYLAELRKNTEQQGSIFDAFPSDVQGNVHCLTSPDEPVMGYVAAHSTDEKSITITKQELPLWFQIIFNPCDAPRTIPQDLLNYYLRIGLYYPADDSISRMPRTPIYVPIECVDCRKKGGTNVEPSDWPF